MKKLFYLLLLLKNATVNMGQRCQYLVRVSSVAVIAMLFANNAMQAQSLAGSTWDLVSATGSVGYTNWGSGVISLTDTVTGSGTCQGAAITETSGYNPTTNFSQCFKVFFGCPTGDQIGTIPSPYTDLNGDGMAFSFWKNSATFVTNTTLACGGGLGYDAAISDNKSITIEFDTYSSLGTSTVDTYYGGGAPGSGINDEISVHKDANSNDIGLVSTTAASNANAGNLEDGKEHQVCITYNATTHIIAVSIDGVSKLSYDLGATDNLNTYFGGATLNYTWSAGKYGANNLQTIAPSGTGIFGVMGHNPCTNAVMPVTYLSFTGELMNDVTVLNWVTTEEKNNKKFIIERSTNLYNWTSIGNVQGGNDLTSVQAYTYTDNTVPNGVVYYRLKQVDNDGLVSYSKVIEVKKEVVNSITISPNPFEQELVIETNVKGEITISICDVLGKIVYQSSQKNIDGSINLHPELSSGAYFITVQGEDFVERKKVVKR